MRKILSLLVGVLLLIGSIGFVFAVDTTAPTFADMPDDWSTAALQKAVANGLLSGYEEGGKTLIKAGNTLTRAEMAAIINRAFAAENKANIASVTDIPSYAWYVGDMAKAVKMGTFMLDAKMRPQDGITRQEAFTVLARAFKLVGSGNAKALDRFSDKADIASWAVESLAGMADAGYIQGSGGKLQPQASITRAEFATVMDNLVKQYIDHAGEVTEVVEGNVIVRVPGVTLKGLTVKGDLIIADGVGEGDVTLDSVKVEGRTVVRGGGENSIIVKGGSELGRVIVAKVDGVVRVFAEDGAEIEVIYVDDGSDDVIVEGTFGALEVAGNEVNVYANKASINDATVSGDNSKIIVGDGSKVKSGSITGDSSAILVDKGGIVDKITISGSDASVDGEGEVGEVAVKEGGDGASIDTPNTKIEVDKDVEGVEAGGTPVEGGQTATNNDTGTGATVINTPPPSSGGGGTSTPATPQVSAITVDKATMTLSTTEVGKTGTITATVGPANATNKTVTWTTSNAEVATVAKGVVTAVGVGEATITAKAGGETATTTVTVVAEEVIAATIGYEAVWNEARGTWYIKVTVPANDLDAASIKSISTIKEAGEKVTEPALTPDTDKVMWFGVAKADGEVTLKAAGEYAYEVVRQDDSKYIFNFTYAPGSVTGVEKPNVVNTTQNKGYNTIKEAITEAVSGATIKLNNNITIEANDFMNNNNDYAVMISGKSLILDLNGKTLSADAYSTVYLASTGVLTLKDSGSGGKIVNTNEETAYNAVGNYGTFTMESGTLDSVNGYALYNHYWSGTMYGTATIEGGTLTGGDRGIANCGILEISGGFITGGVYDIDNSGKLTISGNMTLDKMVVKDGSHAAGVVGKGTLTVGSGVTISGSGLNSTIEVNDGATITIEGTNNFYSADGNTQLTVTELPGKDFNWDSDKWVVAPIYVTPTTLQTALDNAEDGTMFILEEGNYGTIYFRQSETKSKPIDVTTWAGDGDVERYREFNDISIVGSTGAEVDQILVEAQQYFSTKEHSNKEYMTTHLSSYIAISNLTIKNIEFTGKEPVAVNLQSIWGHSSVNGLTIDGCTLTGKDEGKTAEASFLLRADGDTSAEIKDNQGSGELIMTTGRSNLTVKNCTVNNVWMPINITEWNGVDVVNNNFSNIGRNHILITGPSTDSVDIIGNTMDTNGERAIRLSKVTGIISIKNNTITKCAGVEDGSLMKISNKGSATVELSGNSWNGATDEEATTADKLTIE